MEKEITVTKAIEQGYECALSCDGDYYIKLADITADDLENGWELFLGSKETFKFKISEKAIAGMFENYIDDQDEVNNEPEQLYDQLAKVDFAGVAAMINPAFTTDYHSVTDIKITGI